MHRPWQAAQHSNIKSLTGPVGCIPVEDGIRGEFPQAGVRSCILPASPCLASRLQPQPRPPFHHKVDGMCKLADFGAAGILDDIASQALQSMKGCAAHV